MKALQKCVLSTVVGTIALVVGVILFWTTIRDVRLAKDVHVQPTDAPYDYLAECKTIEGNHHIRVSDGHRGSKYATADGSVYAPVFRTDTEDHGQSVRLIAKIDGFADVDQISELLDPDNVRGVIWNRARVPREAQIGLRENYRFIAFATCKVIDLTHSIPAETTFVRRSGALSLMALALISLIYATFSSWEAWKYVENRYSLLDKSTLPDHTQEFFAAQSERLEKLGFKRVCDLDVSSKTQSNIRTLVSADLKTVAIIESSAESDCYTMGSITVDGTYLRTCSKKDLAVKHKPVVSFKAPSDDAALGYAAHHKGCIALEKQLGVERLTFDPRNVLGFLDYDNRVTGWARFEAGDGGRPEPLPNPEEIHKERGNMKIYKWAASKWTEAELEAAGV